MQKLIDKQTEQLQNKLLSSREYHQHNYQMESPLELIKEQLKSQGISNKMIGAKLGIADSTVSKLLKGDRSSRNNIIKLCIFADLNLEQTNQVLKYLALHVLYVKDNRDAAIIHGISFGKSIDEINQTLADNNQKKL